MYKAIETIWLKGAQGKPARLKRQVMLSNQIALFGAVCTLPYQMFYLFYDVAFYLPVFLFNIFFIALYCCVPAINSKNHPDAARNLVLLVACTQIPVVTYFIGAGAGVHLFFFSIGALLSLLFFRRHNRVLLTLLVTMTVLFLVCQFALDQGATPVPHQFIGVMFTGSVVGAMALSSSIAYLFRLEIDQAEKQLVQSNRNLEKLSVTDQLTGLANRRSLDQFLEREWARLARNGQVLSMLMCDVDFFKAFNDHYGHHAGDICLQKIAHALQRVVRRPSDLIARYGGEEFAIILPHTTEAGAQTIAERLRVAVEQLRIDHGYSGVSDVVTLSVGGSTLRPDRNSHWHPLLTSADDALYIAKSRGRNCVVFESLMLKAEDT